MENRPFSLPTGEAFIVRTPYLDKISDRLYKEQQQRDAQYKAEGQALDNDFSKNLSGVRDADIPEMVNKYGEYKNLWKQLNKKGNVISPQQQLELLGKKAAVLSHINKSKQEKEIEELAAKDIIKNPNNFTDGAHKFLVERRNTPVSGFKKEIIVPGENTKVPVDMSNVYDNILYRGNNTDFTPVLKKAEGQLQPRGKTVEVKSPDGLTTTLTTFKAPNSTSEYLELLHNGVKGSRGERDFLMKHQYDDNEAQQIIDDYTKLRQTPEFQNAYPNEPEIPASMMLTPLGRSMALASMEHSITHPPVAIVGKPFNNTGAVMDKRREEGMADWLRKNKITFGQSMQKIAANKAAGQPPEDLGYLSDNVADESGEDLKVKLNGKESTRRVIFVDKVDPDRLNIIIGKDPSQKKQGVKAVPIKVPNADGSYTVKMGYYQDPVTGDWEGLDGQKISRERVKDAYINKYAPSKFKAGAGTKAAEVKKGKYD